MHLEWVGSVLDWSVAGAVSTVIATFVIYRVSTRTLGWGPKDV
jgi:hypothetical protein